MIAKGWPIARSHEEDSLRLSLALLVGFIAACGFMLSGPAVAQGSGAWAFCYVDPPTFKSGSYVYTRVIYVGNAPIPKAEIAAAMAQVSPQVASRPISCWRYSSQLEAETRRREGMTLDRGRGYSVLETSWASPYSPGSEPAQASAEAPASEASPVQAGADTPAASKDSRPPTPKPAASKAAPAKPQWEIEYEAKMAVYEQELARQKAAVAEFERAQAELARSREEQAERARKAKAEWEAKVAACKAGDHSKCQQAPQ